MSTEAFDQLRTQMMSLSESERAELAHDLLKSLDGSDNENNEQAIQDAWEIEIKRRIDQIDSGQAKLINRDEFRKRMRARITQQ